MYIVEKPIKIIDFINQVPNPESGAMVQFTGLVRDHHQGRQVKKLFYDCYESMAEKQIQNIISHIKKKYPVDQILLRHRIGDLKIGDIAILIIVSAAHRDEAFLACREIIEEVKRSVPIWKKEDYQDGTQEWVEPSGHSKP